MVSIPNTLTYFRISIGPMLFVCGLFGYPRLFTVLFLFSMVTDCLDGYLARKLNQVTEWGARLDSWGDLSIFLTVPWSVALLWPGIIIRDAPFIAAALVSYAVPTLFGVIKFGRQTSYHTWGAKLSAVLMGVSLMIMFAGGSSLPFRLSIPVLVLEAAEEVAMTVILPEWKANVPSLWHAVAIVRGRTEMS